MIPEDTDPYNQNEQEEPLELYSKNAIRGFSVFFSPLFGGFLLCLNLWRAGYKQAVGGVAAFCIGYMVISSIIISALGAGSNSLSIAFNIIGAFILSDYFFTKYFPEDDYYPRSIVKPLIASLLITIPLVYLLIHYGGAAGLAIK